MGFQAILDRIIGRVEKQEVKQAVTWRDLCCAIFDGREPSAEAVADAMAANGKTVEDLRRDVEALAKRQSLVERYRRAKAAIRQRDADVSALNRADRNSALPVAERDRQVNEIRQRIADADATINADYLCRLELIRSCDEPVLVAPADEARAAIGQAEAALNAALMKAEQLRKDIATERAAKAHWTHNAVHTRARECQATIERLETASAAAEAEIAAARQAHRAAEERLSAAEERMCEA